MNDRPHPHEEMSEERRRRMIEVRSERVFRFARKLREPVKALAEALAKSGEEREKEYVLELARLLRHVVQLLLAKAEEVPVDVGLTEIVQKARTQVEETWSSMADDYLFDDDDQWLDAQAALRECHSEIRAFLSSQNGKPAFELPDWYQDAPTMQPPAAGAPGRARNGAGKRTAKRARRKPHS